ncbi:spheniscin-2 [Aptenodytes patagonicus]|uniref:spheniscin-2 n=1 Tax=Aptenodytes patagonicus TaxID=9234 RepID=UPI003F9FE3EF
MKILYLLFPFFLLLIQSAADERGRAEMGSFGLCRLRRGFCARGRCRFPSIPIGRCSRFVQCCRR